MHSSNKLSKNSERFDRLILIFFPTHWALTAIGWEILDSFYDDDDDEIMMTTTTTTTTIDALQNSVCFSLYLYIFFL